MSEPIPAEVALWQELGKYLKTETEISAPEAIQDPRYGAPKKVEVVRLNVRFTNTAYCEPDLPWIVFTGVGLSIVEPPPGQRRGAKWEKYDVKIETPQHTQPRRTDARHLRGGWGREGKEWEDLTPDESAHGIALFPGDSAAIELTIPKEDLRESDFRIHGSVSRRHFFHCDRALAIPQA